MKRIKLCHRSLPHYTCAEELCNALTHGMGILLGIAVLILCGSASCHTGSPLPLWGSVIYGCSMILLYTISTVYHALPPGMGKKVLQILDHCSIYLLIAGTYTPILITVFLPEVPGIGWGFLILQWAVSALAITLNAIDLRRFRIFSYIAYIILGWSILLVLPVALRLIPRQGFFLLLLGGISYTVGAVLYAIGSKKPWFHSIFHIFVLLGSLLQFFSIYLYML